MTEETYVRLKGILDMDYLEGRITGYSQKEELIRQYRLWYKTMAGILEEQYHEFIQE